jgi:uncharacterized delta-60 repeat protein
VFSFASAMYTVVDSAGSVAVTVTRAGGSAGAVGVTLSTSDGTALSDIDYTAYTQNLTFAPGVVSQTVSLDVMPEPVANAPARTFEATLSNPTGGASLGATSSAVVSITHVNLPGDLDGLLGVNGQKLVVVGNGGYTPAAVAGLSDGSTLVVSNGPPAEGFALTQAGYYTQTNPPTEFSIAGHYSDQGFGIAGTPNGQIEVVGEDQTAQGVGGFLIARFASGGYLDTTFNKVGYVAEAPVAANATEKALAVAVLSNGQYLVYGTSTDNTTSVTRYEIQRLNTNGTLDKTFGTAETLFLAAGLPTPNADLVEPSGALLVSATGTNPELFVINPDGTLNSSFGTGGIARAPASDTGSGGSIALFPDGEIVQSDGLGNVLRFSATGQLQTSFGVSGLAATGLGAVPLTLGVEQPDGKIVVAATEGMDGNGHAAGYVLTRLNVNGSIDHTFASNGSITITSPNSVASGNRAQQGGGMDQILGLPQVGTTKILVVGVLDGTTGMNANSPAIEFARFDSNQVLDDYLGTGSAQPSYFRRINASLAEWFVKGSTTLAGRPFGSGTLDVPLSGDFDGDNRLDLAIYRPSTAQWFVEDSNSNYAVQLLATFGQANLDIPVPADYNGNGVTIPAVYRPTTGQWFVYEGGSGKNKTLVSFPAHSIPVPGPWSVTGPDNAAVYNPANGQWLVAFAGEPAVIATFGGPKDIPVPGDYDPFPSQHTIEPAVWRPSTGQFFVHGPNGNRTYQFAVGDIPAPGDYDGTDATEPAVYRPTTGQWFVWGPNDTGPRLITTFGGPRDIPLLAPYSYRALSTGGVQAFSVAAPIQVNLGEPVGSVVMTPVDLKAQAATTMPPPLRTAPTEPSQVASHPVPVRRLTTVRAVRRVVPGPTVMLTSEALRHSRHRVFSGS